MTYEAESYLNMTKLMVKNTVKECHNRTH